MSSKNCSRCGHASSDDALFCPRCGNSLGAAADPLVGTVIADRYLLIEKVGAGNSGTIYRGEHTTLRKKVAVKVLHHELSTDEKAMERFQREATTVGELDNEHIVQVIDFGRAADGRLFFAQEYLDGETLASLLQREHQLAIPRTIDIVGQIAEALMEAHALGYVHRDLRPRNVILIKKRGRVDFVKLLDFGLSKLVMPSDPKPGTTQVLSIGDPRYMAPELARGETVDRRADLYSLGVIAFEMLTGAVPFEGTTPAEVLQKIGAGPAPSVRARRSDCPEWLDKVVQTALQRDPERRFITVLKMQEHLAAQSAPQVEDVAPAPVAASRNETKPFPLVDLSESAPAPQSAKAAEPPRAPVDEVKKTPEPAPVAANRPMPSPVVASRPEPSPVVASRPEPAPVVASKPEPVPVAVKREEPRPAPAPAPDRRAEEARAAAQAARPATVQPGAPMQFGGKKSKKQMKEDRRREEEKRRKEEARPQAMTAQPPAPQAPAAVAAKSESGAATMSQSARPADRSSSSGESDTGRRAKAGSSDVGAAKVQLSPDLATRAETKNGTDKRVESSRFTKAGMPETGEHERVWFDDSSSPKPLADGEEHYDDDKRKNLGLYVGFAVPTVLVVVLVTAVVLWRVNAPRQEEKHRSYDDETTVSVKAAPDKERVPGQPGEAAEGQAAENPPPQVAAPVVVIDEAARAKAEAEVKAGEEAVERERAAEEAKAKEEAKARMSPEERAALEAKEKEDAKIAAKQKIADEAKAKEDAKVLAKAEAKAKAEAEAKAKADEAAAKKAEAKAKAEAEAKAKADAAAAKKAEAKAKAEAEMLAKGDTAAIKKAEAKAKAEADAQAKADAAAAKKAEAKSKADAEAQAKADAAAAKKAEAKAKGDTEAKAKPVKTTPTKEATASAAGATKETFAGGGGGGGEAEFYLKLGRQKLNAGDYSGATSNFKKAISLDSKSGEGQAGLGEVSFEQGDYGQAAAALRKAIAVAPKKSRYHLLLGQALYKEGLYAEAGGECKRVLTSEPGNQEAKRCAEAADRKLGH